MTDGLEPGQAYWKLIEPIWEEANFYETWNILQRDFRKISEKQRSLYAIHWADREICNGGYEQFFFNSTGMLAPEAVVGYRAIGMLECAELLHMACLRLGTPYPRERDERQERLDTLFAFHPKANKAFCNLEERYFKIKDKEAGGFDVAADRYATSD